MVFIWFSFGFHLILSKCQRQTATRLGMLWTTFEDGPFWSLAPSSTVLGFILAPSWRFWRLFWLQVGLLGGSWAILGPIWRQEGPKSENIQKTQTFSTPFWRPSWNPNPSKIDPEACQKVVLFLIGFGIGCWWHLDPTWVQLGRWIPPKIEPSWFQNQQKSISYTKSMKV